jgi:DNA-binding NarL/FixJ family response regulator
VTPCGPLVSSARAWASTRLLQARMQALSAPTRHGMLLLAAAGRLHASDLAGLLGLQRVESCLAEAADAGMLAAESDGMLRFSHPLLAGLAYADARAADRRAAHARLAGHVQDPERRAWHLAASLIVPDATAASELAAASRIAAARGAVHTAAELAERARQLTPAVEAGAGSERGFAAAQLYDAASEPGRAGRLLRHLAQTAPTPSHQARALLGLSDLAGHDLVTGRALAEQAVALAGEDRPVAALALGQLGTILLVVGDVPAASQALNHAVDVGRATGNADAELRALHTLVDLELFAGTPDLSAMLAAVERAAASASAARGYLHPATRAGLVSLVRDEPEEARRVLLTALADAEQAGDYAAARGPMLLMVQALIRGGDLTAAADALARLQRWDPYGDDAPMLHVIALLAACRGDCPAAAEAATRGTELARLGNDTRFLAANLSVLGFLEVSRGEFTAALAPLRETRSISRQLGTREPGVLRWHEDHIEASLAAGFLDEAAEIAVELQAQADALGRPGLRVLADRCTGLVQAAGGDTAQAIAILAAAARPGAEQPFEHARTLLAYGTVARRARRKAAASQALTAAQTSFTAIGAVLWARRAASELRRVGLRTTPGTLTETERRIAELVSTGYTNREVAAELFLSAKTVEANLSRIYHKLQIRSRAQLARALADHHRP